MSNTAWECPRCKRMNAPFNPVCFCKHEDKPNAWEIAFKESKNSFNPGWVAHCSDCGLMLNGLTKHLCKVSM